MRSLVVATVSALIVATAFAPAAQARHRKKVVAAAPAPMMAPMSGNPRMNADGDFYATPISGPDLMGGVLAPLAIPGVVAGGAAGTGLDILSAPLK